MINSIGDFLRSCRDSKGLSQAKLAKIVGVSKQTILKWENDQTRPNLDQINALSSALLVSPSEICSGVASVISDTSEATHTDRYCPDCFRRLYEGQKNWYWCPDTYYCEFECDISKEDKTLSQLEMYVKKLEKTKLQLSDLNQQYERDKTDLEKLIASLSSKISDSSPAGISEAKPKPTPNK